MLINKLGGALAVITCWELWMTKNFFVGYIGNLLLLIPVFYLGLKDIEMEKK